LALIREGILYEAIISLLDDLGKPYATPSGFWKSNGRILVKFYKGFKTHELLVTVKNPVLNIVRDPLLYYRTAFKAESSGLTPEDYVVDEVNGRVFLRNAEAYLLLDLIRTVDYGKYSLFEYDLREIRVNPHIHLVLEPYSRCYSSLIEMIIYATKIRARSQLSTTELETALRSIEYSYNVAVKTCMDSAYMDLANTIRKVVEDWLGK
jgi:hypothetical protein